MEAWRKEERPWLLTAPLRLCSRLPSFQRQNPELRLDNEQARRAEGVDPGDELAAQANADAGVTALSECQSCAALFSLLHPPFIRRQRSLLPTSAFKSEEEIQAFGSM